MATPNPPQAPPILTPEQRLALEQKQKYDNLLRNLAIGGIIICPAIVLMPPRKLDLYTFSLAAGTYLSADHLSSHYTSRPLVHHLLPGFFKYDGLPTDKAREVQAANRRAEEERRKRDGAIANEQKGIVNRLWMGGEKEGWKERRLEEERRKLEQGESYTSMILDQIWEVWNWDKKKGDEGKVE
ncbi:hypothetical protein K491DRAFT_565438, partial [Lophiostoma macrostomum CBS 122681]